MLAIAFSAVGAVAAAAIRPESDVLLPWFEIDLERTEGPATTFSIVNASPTAARTLFTVYTNWGIPVLEVPVEFQRTEARTIDLGAWIAHGVLPDRILNAAELARLRAALTGKKSPADGLYYGTPYKDGVAVGYVIVQTLDDRADSLWGDTYTVDASVRSFQAETLVSLTHGLEAECKRHGLRYVNGEDLYQGEELIIWSGRRFSPSATPDPASKVNVTITVYDQSGHRVGNCHRELIAVEPLALCDLGLNLSQGWLDIATDEPTFILEHLHSATQGSAELHSYCLSESLKLEGPNIAIDVNIGDNPADNGPGPSFAVGAEVEFKYVVTNSGTEPLAAVSVSDATGLTVTCPKAALAPGESMTCTARMLAAGCQNAYVGTATGTTSGGAQVSATDLAYYEGLYEPALELEMLVNGDEADGPTGPLIDAGDALNWTFVVTNRGDAPLDKLAVSRAGQAAACPKSNLDPGESMTCSAQSPAVEGQQHDLGTATATTPCGRSIAATDSAYYFGRKNAPSIEIEKMVGENEADTPPGPGLPVGTTIEWRFVVTNTGNLSLQGIVVTDDQGITPTCPKTTLAPGESMTCTASSPVLACEHANDASVSATVEGQARTVTANDRAYYTGLGHPAVTLELKINGDPADEPPGPWIDENANILFTYELTNTGDVELTSIAVNDDSDRIPLCPKTSLQPGESMVCSASALAVVGNHDFAGSVHAVPPCGNAVEAQDPAFYRGRALTASLDLVKLTNAVHADSPPGPSVPVGSTIQWSYVVTNTGMLALSNVLVSDSPEAAITCPKTALEPGESMTCTASGIAQACQYSNTATVQGTPSGKEPVSASDQGFYFGEHHAAITMDKKIYGQDAPQPPGPTVMAGSTIQWTFIVTNTGDVSLANLGIVDLVTGSVACPKTTLAPAESMTCTASSIALGGQQQNTATVTGQPPCGAALTATDTSYYVGLKPEISIEKLVNGQEADDPAHAVEVTTGSTLLWSYIVTNSGNATLHSVGVTDDQGLTVTCPKASLAAGESMTCTASGIAQAGLVCNIGTATGTTAQSLTVTAQDPACYHGTAP